MSREKIDEIAELDNDIYNNFQHISHRDSRNLAENLYDDGWRKQSEWISADNPPETYRDEYEELIPFLVCCNGTKYPFRALYDGTNWGDGIGRLDVTHWMPLPSLPDMKGGE
jgi:hypothetical protein